MPIHSATRPTATRLETVGFETFGNTWTTRWINKDPSLEGPLRNPHQPQRGEGGPGVAGGQRKERGGGRRDHTAAHTAGDGGEDAGGVAEVDEGAVLGPPARAVGPVGVTPLEVRVHMARGLCGDPVEGWDWIR